MKLALPSRALAAGLLLSVGLLWLAWPWLRPRLWPAGGSPWLVVLDGYHRLDAALERQVRTAEPILLITCPSSGQPTVAQSNRQRQIGQRLSGHPLRRQLLPEQAPFPLLVLRQGFDTATQAVALADWMEQRQRQGQAAPRQLLLISDPHHFPRARWAAQIAAGGHGTQVLPLPVESAASPRHPESFAPDWPSWRDALRLQLWRATGSTAAVLVPVQLERKIRACRFNP